MTEVRPQAKAGGRASRRPGPAAVIWGSVALFAVLFALFTYQLSAPAQPRQHVLVRKVVKRRVVTTVVPTPGESTVTSGPAVSSTQSTTGAAPVATSAS
ncbi:MAG TPA: hypothetical protein VFG58_00030 [Solirubrobacterales bacterium]|nr:hypothetical protein [Solirubrobacterales bacterium]